MAEVSDIKLFGKWSYDDVDVSDPPLPMPRSRLSLTVLPQINDISLEVRI